MIVNTIVCVSWYGFNYIIVDTLKPISSEKHFLLASMTTHTTRKEIWAHYCRSNYCLQQQRTGRNFNSIWPRKVTSGIIVPTHAWMDGPCLIDESVNLYLLTGKWRCRIGAALHRVRRAGWSRWWGDGWDGPETWAAGLTLWAGNTVILALSVQNQPICAALVLRAESSIWYSLLYSFMEINTFL